MSRRTERAAEKAAMEASEAGRVLQAQRQPEEQVVEKSEKPEGNRPAPRNEDRRLAMEEVINRHHKTPGYEEVEPPKAEEKVEPKVEPVEEKVEPKVEAQPVAEPTPEPVIATVKVKIDGQELEVPQAEVDDYGGVKGYQIAKAAEKRLEAANTALAQTKQTQSALAKWVQQQNAARQPKPQTADELIASKIDVIRYGTPEESAAALKEIVTAGKVDPDQIEQRISLKMSISTAAARFKEEFSDIATNPMLMKLAQIREQEVLNTLQAIPSDWNAVYRGIGNEIRSVIGRPHQPATPTAQASTTSSPDKEARKASITNLPTAATRAEVPKEEKPETRDDVLNQMRKSRGLPTG